MNAEHINAVLDDLFKKKDKIDSAIEVLKSVYGNRTPDRLQPGDEGFMGQGGTQEDKPRRSEDEVQAILDR